MFKWTAVITHSERVTRDVDKILNVPRRNGSGSHEDVMFPCVPNMVSITDEFLA